MKPRSAVLTAMTISAVLLTGCASSNEAASGPTPTLSTSSEAKVEAADIVTIDDGIIWARGLSDSTSADELSLGITTIGELVPQQDLWFEDSNEIGRNLIALNAEVQAAPEDAGTKVDDLNAIIDDLETAIEKGNTP
ncbi:hypothetical protein M4D51_08100 [Microbacterium sp. p3-SID338]|uniref:hypothetical protein n=1 Tax=Microbacterium sp. p3-SID338 TaxID=2916214 RepID=UPI0021A8C8AC|nr:hypothetical protein [Microbacterium sp. p3-SID338]MCT1395687.1 hypothetical protein [Microbacterium sp. p3-SID338]